MTDELLASWEAVPWALALQILGVGALIAAVATWLTRRFALRTGFVSKPNPIVPQHVKPVAHLGGIAIYVGASLTLLLFALVWERGIYNASVELWIPATAFLAIGILDDIYAFRPLTKLLLQISNAGIAASMGFFLPITGVNLIDGLLAVGFIVTVVNAFNLVDVCDGLTAGLGVVLFLFLAKISPGFSVLSLACAGACLGFLFFNKPPASIFLGDTGSHLLGFLAAAIILDGGRNAPPWPYALQALLLVAVPLFELLFLIVIRRRKGLRFWRGSPDHFSLRLQQAGLSKWVTDHIAWAAAGTLGTIALALPTVGLLGQIGMLALVLALARLAWVILLPLEVDPTKAKPREEDQLPGETAEDRLTAASGS